MSNNYTDVTKSSLIINKLTRAQYEASSKDENQLWILTDVVDFQADLTENIYAPSKKYEGQITQHIGETTGKYIQGYFYKCVAVGEEPNITYVWQNINSQPAQVLNWGNIGGTLSDQSDLQGALDSKLTTTDEASKVYGTNDQGEQVLYNVAGFGQVDDVQIHGDSKVVSKIANLSVVEQLNTIPTATVDYKDRIIQYTGETDNTYTNGFFYKCKEIPGSKYVINPEWHNPEGLTSIELDDALIQSQVIDLALAHGYTYVNGVEVGFASKQIAPVGDGSLGIRFNDLEQLAQYGFIVTGTPTNNTCLSYNIVENPQPTYEWERVDVQPATDVSGKVDKTTDASKVYGTDENGDQTTYDVNDFGQIDNVAIHGVDQTITDKRVDLKVVEQVYEMPDITDELFGRVVQYLGEDTEDYTFGYFYKAGIDTDPTNIEGTATATITNTETFLNKVNRVSSIVGKDLGSSVVILGDSSSAYKIKWYDTQGSEVSVISQYPVTTFETETGIKVEGTVDENTRITFETVPHWKQLNTQQSSAVFRRIVEEE